MVKIYTRMGDTGETSLLGGRRVRKDNLRVEAFGSIDEVNAAVGLVRMELGRGGVAPAGLDELLAQIQHQLFDLGAELAKAQPTSAQGGERLTSAHVAALEAEIDRLDPTLAPLRAFILPGGVPAAAELHLARCICRRAERRLVALAAAEPVRSELLRYVNRLSDLLFVLARALNQANRVPDVIWEQGAGSKERGVRDGS